ncbi:hypothetical protein GCM10009651_35920 [Microbacterium natoriense]|uniref:NUMOD4 motif-containing HNH endonuclease n=1 Tax=Microbacterium natoriense TaxID=284570 RepID=UPI00336CBCF5
MTERWAAVVGFENLYEVSDLGNVRSIDREVTYSNGGVRRYESRVLTGRVTASGHVRVSLYGGTRGRDHFVHRLVLESFVGPRPDGMEGCHENGVPGDNRLTNLRWDTTRGNHLDRVKHGMHHETRKTHCPRGHAYEGENLIITKGGWRKCRECHRVRSAERHARVRAAAEAGGVR